MISHVRNFIHKNSGFFTLVFLFIFFVEQLLLMLITYYLFEISTEAQLLIGIFALIVLTTAAGEKFILEKKYQYLSKEFTKAMHDNERILLEMKKLYDNYEDLYTKYIKIKSKKKK